MTTIRPNNRPGLANLDYRAGTHAAFKATMLARLSSADLPPLAQLTTRSDDDFTIALLDAWACAADVLTFYTERIANESYLGTATERRSLSALGGLVGYQPHPGVAASAHLAFTLEEGPGDGEITAPAGLQVMSIPAPGEQPQTFETVEPLTGRPEWNALRPTTTTGPAGLSPGRASIHLRGINTNLNPGDMVLVEAAGKTSGEPATRIARPLLSVRTDPAANTTTVELDNPLEEVRPIIAVYAMRQRAALFGHNAPKYDDLPANHTILADGTRKELKPKPFDVNWETQPLNEEPGVSGKAAAIDLDRAYPQVTPGSWLVLSSPTINAVYKVQKNLEMSRADHTLSGRISRITLDTSAMLNWFGLRDTVVFAQSEQLALAGAPVTAPVSGASVLVDGLHPDLPSGRAVAITGIPEGCDAAASEIVTLTDVERAPELRATKLTFITALARKYERGTVTINANVVRATHGETRVRDIGTGDGAASFQKFVLPEAPLTFVAADNPHGAVSTLAVYVNGQQWAEVPWLHGRGPDERVYVTRIDDDGRATIAFGDGTTGARLPTATAGAGNVQASYRTGIGLEGAVAAGQLALLKTSPLGVRSVTNPLPSRGAAARESLDDIRRNAPLPVRCLGRIVSLRDYEDFARAFGGVAKALATWAWSGNGRVVLLTVAGDNGAAIEPGSDIYRNLLAAMRAAGDPAMPVQLKTYRPAYFQLACTLTTDPAYDADAVAGAVEETLRGRFSFANREFAQQVTLSEVYAGVHAVRGVRAAHVEELRRVDDFSNRRVNEALTSDVPRWVPGQATEAAELLLLDPRSDRLEIRKG